MSVFQSVLDRLKSEEADEPPAKDHPAAGIRGLTSGFVAASVDHAGVAGSDVQRAYADFAIDIPVPPVVETHVFLKRTRPDEIAEDLGLTGAETVLELGVLRRAFAAANHPDLHPASRKENAARRMTIANMLIDAAIRGQTPRRKP